MYDATYDRQAPPWTKTSKGGSFDAFDEGGLSGTYKSNL